MYGFTKDRGGIMRCGSEIDSGQCNSLNGIPLSSRPTGRDKPRRLLRLFIVRYVVYCVRAEMGRGKCHFNERYPILNEDIINLAPLC